MSEQPNYQLTGVRSSLAMNLACVGRLDQLGCAGSDSCIISSDFRFITLIETRSRACRVLPLTSQGRAVQIDSGPVYSMVALEDPGGPVIQMKPSFIPAYPFNDKPYL